MVISGLQSGEPTQPGLMVEQTGRVGSLLFCPISYNNTVSYLKLYPAIYFRLKQLHSNLSLRTSLILRMGNLLFANRIHLQ